MRYFIVKMKKRIIKKCKYCKKEFESYISVQRIFCSRECASKNNIGKKRPIHSINLKKAHKRKSFGYKKDEQHGNLNPAKRPEIRKKISNKAKGKNNYFYNKHFTRELNGNWQGGKKFEKYGFNWTEILRMSIRERDSFICQVCGKFGNTVHHIDYNKKNNNVNNLINLCRKCHSKTGKKKDRENWTIHFNKLMEIRNVRG